MRFRNKSTQEEHSSMKIEETDTAMEMTSGRVDPHLAWEVDGKLIELAAKYNEAKAAAQAKGDILRRKANEILLHENMKSNTPNTSSKNVDEILSEVDKTVSDDSRSKNIYRRYLLKKAAKASWTDDKDYKQAAIDYLTYIIPYLEELDSKSIDHVNELKRMKLMHQSEEMAVNRKLISERTTIEALLSVCSLQGALSVSTDWEIRNANSIAQSKRIVEAEIRTLMLGLNDPDEQQSLLSLNDKLFNQHISDGEVTKIF